MNTVIPTLNYMVDPILSEPIDKILHLVRYFIYNPGFITTTYSELELSFRGIATRYPNKPQAVVDHINRVLGQAIQRCVPELTLTTEVEFRFISDTNYSLSLNVLDSDGNPFIPQSQVVVKDNNLEVIYKGV